MIRRTIEIELFTIVSYNKKYVILRNWYLEKYITLLVGKYIYWFDVKLWRHFKSPVHLFVQIKIEKTKGNKMT